MEKIHMSEDKTKNKKSDDKKSNDNKSNDKKQKKKEYFKAYQKKHTQVRITFNNSDYDVVNKIASEQGLTLASFIRLATMEQAKNIYLFPKEIDEQLKVVTRNLRGIATNINQIARYTNEQRYSSSDTIQVLLNFLKNLEDEIKKIKRIIEDWRNAITPLYKIEKQVKKLESILIINKVIYTNKIDNIFIKIYSVINKEKYKNKKYKNKEKYKKNEKWNRYIKQDSKNLNLNTLLW